ncbi:MAG: hypothetical protein WC291_10130 [Thermodesulfovibrionales bacterium]|jgi:hypothetical protein
MTTKKTKTKLTGEYKGYTIELNSFTSLYDIRKEGIVVHRNAATLAGAEKWIDDEDKTSYVKVRAWYYAGTDYPPTTGTVTSLASLNSYRVDDSAWFVRDISRLRAIETRTSLFPMTPENEAAREAISLKQEAIKDLRKEIEDIVKKLIPLQVEDVRPDTKKKGETPDE